MSRRGSGTNATSQSVLWQARGFALEHVDPALRGDRDVVLAATSCQTWGSSTLKFASDDDMMDNRDILAAAIEADGEAIEHDRERLLPGVMRSKGRVIGYLSGRLPVPGRGKFAGNFHLSGPGANYGRHYPRLQGLPRSQGDCPCSGCESDDIGEERAPQRKRHVGEEAGRNGRPSVERGERGTATAAANRRRLPRIVELHNDDINEAVGWFYSVVMIKHN